MCDVSASVCCRRFCRSIVFCNADIVPCFFSAACLLLPIAFLPLPFASVLFLLLIESYSGACCTRHIAYNVSTIHGSFDTLLWSVFALPLPIALVFLVLQRHHRRLDAQILHLD